MPVKQTKCVVLSTDVYKVVSEKEKLDSDASDDQVIRPSSTDAAETKKWTCCSGAS